MASNAPAGVAAGRRLDIGSRAVLNTVVLMAAKVVSRLAALVLVIVLANHLHPAGYGRYTTLVAYSALVSVAADLGLNTLYTREAARAPADVGRFLGTLAGGKLVLGAASAAILAAALESVGLGGLALPGAALLLTTTYANLFRNTFYALGRLEFEAVAIAAETVIQAALIVLGAHRGAGVAWFVWAYAASYGFTVLYCLFVIAAFRMGRPRLGFEARLFGGWVRTALPFAIGIFLTNLYFKADVPILQHFRPFREVGWYEFAYKPFEALQFVPLAVQSVVYPVLAVYHASQPGRVQAAYERFFKVLVLLGIPVAVGTFVLVAPIGRAFHLYPQSEPALRILAAAIPFLFVNSAFTAMLFAVDRQDLFAWTTAIAVVVNVGLNVALIPAFGYLAAAATTVVTEAAFSAGAWWFVRRRHRLPWLRLSWRILLAGVVMAAVLYPLRRHSLAVTVPAGAVVYLAALWTLRAVDREEVAMLRRSLRPRPVP
ncbi:MAG: flippase [Candidatus Dormibacterales bacterium]